ncbi:hypothetical protein [Acidianus sp. HS-5]|uniref:hypothetical protein n=1 Tax=Acidianus sp. HS-5 TaxID=2886040 RepID=UPI001F42CFE4|nr:hypothetical protein [Acidianus sp. HS-5]BDC17375.1 hypothetical protein HS5_02650 [Acidianus sp. HS-5]
MSEVLEQIISILLTIASGILGGFLASIFFSRLTTPNLKLSVEKTSNNDKCIDFKMNSTLHIRVINDKRLLVYTNSATECIGEMWIFYTENDNNKIYYYNKDKRLAEITKETKFDDLTSPYTLKWANLPSSDYKRNETIIDIPCGICENGQPGRQLDILGVRETKLGGKYILIQDVQQQATRDGDDLFSAFKKCNRDTALYNIDRCLFDSPNQRRKELINQNILKIAFDFPQNRTYYIVVEINCANTKLKIGKRYKIKKNKIISSLKPHNKNLLFKIKLDNDKICIYDEFNDNDYEIVNKIVKVFASRSN